MKKTNRVPDSRTIRPDSEKNIEYPVKPDRDRISGTSLHSGVYGIINTLIPMLIRVYIISKNVSRLYMTTATTVRSAQTQLSVAT